MTSAGLDRGDGGAAAHDGDVVGDREHLVELVGDEDQGVALGLELAQVREERVDLLRHQHRGRLVEDDDLGAAVEHLEDLHALPLADAERLDELVGVEVEAVASSEISSISARASSPMPCSFSAPSTTFSSTVRLSASMKCWKTMPMPELDRVGRRARTSTASPSTSMVPVVGLLHAVQDLHQRRLAGAVLADEGVDRAGADVDVDVVVGDHAREALADAAQPDRDGRRSSAGGAGAGDSSCVMAHAPTVTVGWTRHGPGRHATASPSEPVAPVLRATLAQSVSGTLISPSMIFCL